MSILTGAEIRKQWAEGRIVIDPYNPAHVGPNSVDVTLAHELQVYYVGECLDMRKDNPTGPLTVPPEGLVLRPRVLYLASTVERVGSDHYVTYIDGRSSVGRLGIQIHMTAGRGDLGFKNRWTLEIEVVHPVRVYAGSRIGQATFHTVEGDVQLYTGRYAKDDGVVASRMWQGFDAEVKR